MLGLALAILLGLAPANALAQAEAAQAAAPGKQPAPPLFPKHRRGIYRDNSGIDVVDATPQSPPLETDDPGVPDKGEYEINLTTSADLSKGEQSVDLLFVDANYGLLPKFAGHELPTQLKFEFPVAAARDDNAPFRLGIGAAKFGVKFNFYDNDRSGLSIALYPQIEFEAPGTGGVRKGLADPGQTFILPLLVAKEFHSFTFVGNGAVNIPVHDSEREATATFGAAVGRALTRKFAAMMEIRDEPSLDLKANHLMFLNVGVMHGLRNFVVYGQVGHSLFSDDGSGHLYIGGGLKLLLHQPPR